MFSWCSILYCVLSGHLVSMHSFFLWLHQIVDLATPNVFAMSMIGLFCHFNVMMAESHSLWNFLRVPALHTWNQPVSYYLLRMSWNKEKQASSFHKTTCQSISYYLEGWVKLLEIILTLEFYLKVYSVITSWLFDVKSTVVVCWGKIEKKKSSYLLILTVSFDITEGISLPLLCECECGRREKNNNKKVKWFQSLSVCYGREKWPINNR